MRHVFWNRFVCIAAPVALLSACANENDASESATADMDPSYAEESLQAEAAADAVERAAPGSGPLVGELGELPVDLPKLAYVYDFAWRLAGEDIGRLQRSHADLCEQQGPASCRILGMSKDGEDADEVTGRLELAVATRHARAFGALLEDAAEDAGATGVSSEIQAEELSKSIVDTQARIAARTELRDRLMDVLRTRRGTIKELVEAERSVAAVNEEIDAAQSWLAEQRGRVAFSRVNIHYESGPGVGGEFLTPIKGALGSVGTIVSYVLAGLIVLAAILLPILGIVLGARWIQRKAAPVES